MGDSVCALNEGKKSGMQPLTLLGWEPPKSVQGVSQND